MSEQYVSLAEVRELLEEENEKRSALEIEFNATQKSALDHAQKNAKLSKEQADALMEEIRALRFDVKGDQYAIPENLVCKIADILPQYKNDVRAVFYKERGINVEESGLDDAVIEIVSKYI